MIATNHADERTFLEQLAEDDRRLEKLFEAVDAASQLIDPLDAYRDGNETWLPLGSGFTGATRMQPLGMLTAGFDGELELSMARDEMRYLAATNPYAINAHENRVSYIVGDGHTYDVKARRLKPGKTSNDAVPQDAGEELVDEAQEAVSSFCELNNWCHRQAEAVLRLDRDGEVFLRLFPGADGVLRVRFIEPGNVSTPPEQAGNPNVRFGIEFDPDDAETPLFYYVKGERVEAKYVQHRKANVDCTTPRGVPLLFGQRMHLRRANKNVLNIAAKIDVIAAIALIRKHAGSAAGVRSSVAAAAQTYATDPRSNQTVYGRRFQPGTILDSPNTVEYEAPSVDGIDNLAAGVALNLRCIASRLVMPEFMVSSDASNANYASTMVAEGPSVKNFERLQKRQAAWDCELLWMALETAGVGPRDDLKRRLEIRVGMPTIVSRDDLKKAEENRILYEAGVMSPQEWSAQATLDYEKNQTEIAEHKAAGRSYKPDAPPPQPFGMPSVGAGANDPGDPSDAANRRAAIRAQIETAESVEEAMGLIQRLAESYS